MFRKGMSFKSFLSFYVRYRRNLIPADIEKDAEVNIDSCVARTLSILGKPRPFDPVNDPEHAKLAEDANTDSVVEERAADLELQERERAKHTRRWVLVPGLTLCLLVEAVSCVQVFAALGIEMPERAFFGLGLAAAIFALIYFTQQQANPKEAEVSE